MYALLLSLCLLGSQGDGSSQIIYSDAPVVKTEVRPLRGPDDPPPLRAATPVPTPAVDPRQSEAARDLMLNMSRFFREYQKPVKTETKLVYVPQKEVVHTGVPMEALYVLGGATASLFVLLVIALTRKPPAPQPVVFVDVDRRQELLLPLKASVTPPKVVSIKGKEPQFRPELRPIEDLTEWEDGSVATSPSRPGRKGGPARPAPTADDAEAKRRLVASALVEDSD